jgi:hypothetical protein
MLENYEYSAISYHSIFVHYLDLDYRSIIDSYHLIYIISGITGFIYNFIHYS